MEKVKKIISIVFSLLLLNGLNLKTFAITDLSHNYYEDEKLVDGTWYKSKCNNKSPSCQKHIIRYESVDAFIKQLKKNLNKTSKKNACIFLKRYSGATAIAVAGIGGVKLVANSKNIYFLLALGTSGTLVYVIKPVREFISSTFDFIPKTLDFLKQKLSHKKLLPDLDKKGLLVKGSELMFGGNDLLMLQTKTDNEIYKGILGSLKTKIFNEEYLDKDILIVSWDNDLERPSFAVKFDSVDFDLNYNKNKSEYFKK